MRNDEIFVGKNGRHFVIREVESEIDRKMAVEFMQTHWLSIHTLWQNIGMSEIDIWQEVYKRAFKLPISLIAYDAENGQVAGLKLNSICEGDMLQDVCFSKKLNAVADGLSEMPTDEEIEEAISVELPHNEEPVDKFIIFYSLFWRGFVRMHMPDVTRLFKFENLAIHKDYANNGLGVRLVDRSLALAREYKCEYATTSASSIGSQCVQKKCGLICARRIEYAAIRDPVFRKWDGNPSTGIEGLFIKL